MGGGELCGSLLCVCSKDGAVVEKLRGGDQSECRHHYVQKRETDGVLGGGTPFNSWLPINF